MVIHPHRDHRQYHHNPFDVHQSSFLSSRVNLGDSLQQPAVVGTVLLLLVMNEF